MRRLLWISLFLIYPILLNAAESVPVVKSIAYESSHIITTDKSKSLYWITVSWITQAERWLIIYDSTTVPADGPINTSLVLYCAVISLSSDPDTGTKSWDWTNHPLYRGTHGIVAVISTNSNGCTTKEADGNNNWIAAGVN